jgi:hypothetical protein
VPDGFAVTASAFRLHLERANLTNHVYSWLDGLDVEDASELARVGEAIRERIGSAPLPPEVERATLCPTSSACLRRHAATNKKSVLSSLPSRLTSQPAIVKVNLLPLPSSDSTAIVPPCALTMDREM